MGRVETQLDPPLMVTLYSILLQGQILHTYSEEDLIYYAEENATCWSICKSNEHCNWFSINTAGIGAVCQLYETCTEIESNPIFVSSQRECGE